MTTRTTSPSPSTSGSTDAVQSGRGNAACCRRPMSSIEVTARGTTLVLHTCASCGRHLWERDGQLADRADLLAGVKTFLEQPRGPIRRRRRRAV